MITLAFYKGSGSVVDRVVRWVTRSAFSHVEILRGHPGQVCGISVGLAWSSSRRDCGVRGKVIVFDPDHWEFVQVPWAPRDAIDLVVAEIGRPYDYLGLVWSQIFNFRRHRRDGWFCSELVAYALGFRMPHELAPGALHDRVQEMNRAYRIGAGEPPEDQSAHC